MEISTVHDCIWTMQDLFFFYGKPWGKSLGEIDFINTRKEFTATLLTNNKQVIYSLDTNSKSTWRAD